MSPLIESLFIKSHYHPGFQPLYEESSSIPLRKDTNLRSCFMGWSTAKMESIPGKTVADFRPKRDWLVFAVLSDSQKILLSYVTETQVQMPHILKKIYKNWDMIIGMDPSENSEILQQIRSIGSDQYKNYSNLTNKN